MNAALTRALSAVKNAQHHETLAIVGVAKHVPGVRYLKHQLAIFLAALNWPSDQRMVRKNTGLLLKLSRNDSRKARMPVMQKLGKTLKVSQRSS
jgi:hypothetical protein